MKCETKTNRDRNLIFKWNDGREDGKQSIVSIVPGERDGHGWNLGGDILAHDKRARKDEFVGEDKATFRTECKINILWIRWTRDSLITFNHFLDIWERWIAIACLSQMPCAHRELHGLSRQVFEERREAKTDI